MIDFDALAHTVMTRLDTLGQISQSPQYLDRRYLTPEHRQANETVAQWMQSAAMTTWQDAAGNLWGRYPSPDKNAPRLLIGSHLDTVPNGGKYDGMLGVVTPVTLLAALHQAGIRFPFHIDVVGFGDEEGTRFGSTLLGSRAVTGRWPDHWGDLKDELGVSLRQAMEEFGLSFDSVHEAAIDTQNLKGYLELHIEQGPTLEAEDLPLGVVSGIAGAKRFEFTVTGMAGHAGTVPMSLRQDALAAASEMILAIEQCAKAHQVVATVGQIQNHPNGVNVISGGVTFSLDLRSEFDNRRDTAIADILAALDQIAAKRRVLLKGATTHAANAVHCDPAMRQGLVQAIEAQNVKAATLCSGAGHDAMAIADICPVAMLFMRCKGGISHHPGESINTQDVRVALATLSHYLQHL